MLFGMIFEFVGLGVIFPLILSLIQPNKLLEFELIDKIYHFLSFTSISHLTYLFLFIILIVYVIKTVFMIYFTHKQNIIIGNFISKISHSLYKIYLNQPFSFHTKNNSSILITSHNLSEVQTMCSNIILLKSGEIVSQGNIKQILTNYNYKTLIELFLSEG